MRWEATCPTHPTRVSRGHGIPTEQPQPWPPACGIRDSQSCPPIPFPSLLAGKDWGCREESGILAELSLGRTGLARGSQSRARSGQQELACFLPPQAAPRHGQRKRGHCRCPNAGQDLATRQDPSQGQAGSGEGGSAEKAGCASESKEACPHASHPPGTQATAVTTVSFYSLHLYIHGIKSSSSTCLLCAAHAGPTVAATGMRTPRLTLTPGVPGAPPTGNRPTLPSQEQPVPGLAWGHPCDPWAVWRVKHQGWIHPSTHLRDGQRAPATAQGCRLFVCRKSPRNMGSWSLPLSWAPSELQSQVLPHGKSPLR